MPHDPEDKKLFDIAKPGKMLPSSSSRPLITGRHNLLQDPMLKAAEPDKDQEEKQADPEIETKTVTAKHWPPPDEASPLEASISPEDQSKDELKKQADQEADQEAKPEDKTETQPDKPKENEPKPEDDLSDDLKEGPQEEAKDQPDDEEVAHPAPPKNSATANQQGPNYDELVQQKTYFAPVGQQRQQRSARRWLIITIIILVAGLLIADLLVDNGTIKTSVQPPIQIFHNNRQ